MRQDIIECLNFGIGKDFILKVLSEKVIAFVKAEDGLQKLKDETEQSVNRKTEIPCLPLQDASWSVAELPLKHCDLERFRILVLSDTGTTQSMTIQFSMEDAAQVSYEDQALQLLYLGCLYPLDGRKSRRPRFLCQNFSHDSSHPIQIQSDNVGIPFCGKSVSKEKLDALQNELKSIFYFRQCSVCGISGNPALFDECNKCGAVLYCSERCKREDLEESHRDWCPQFKEFMAKETELADLPFDFAGETTGRDFHELMMKDFLNKCGIDGPALGLLKYEHPENESVCSKSSDNQSYQEITDRRFDGFSSIEEDSTLLESHPPPLDKPLSGWKDYYSLRGFPQNSLISVLLHFPLTLYYIISQLLSKDFAETFYRMQQSYYVCVHVIGAEEEVKMFHPFLECARLLTPVTLDIHLFGNNFDESYHGEKFKKENLNFHIHKGLYHKTNLDGIPSPSLAVCFNGGIGAYTSYIKTIRLLVKRKTPLYYTDYGEACIMFSTKAIMNSKAGILSPPLVNPFRSPLRMMTSDQNLPRYSNAFVTHIKPYSNPSENAPFL